MQGPAPSHGCGEGGCSATHVVFDQLEQVRCGMESFSDQIREAEARMQASFHNQIRGHADRIDRIEMLLFHDDRVALNKSTSNADVASAAPQVASLIDRVVGVEASQRTTESSARRALQASLAALRRWEEEDEWQACCDGMGNGRSTKKQSSPNLKQLTAAVAAAIPLAEGRFPPDCMARSNPPGRAGNDVVYLAEKAHSEMAITELQAQVKELQIHLGVNCQQQAGQFFQSNPGSHGDLVQEAEWTALGLEERVDVGFKEFRRRLEAFQGFVDHKVLLSLYQVEHKLPEITMKLDRMSNVCQDQLSKSKEHETHLGLMRRSFDGYEQRLIAFAERLDRLPVAHGSASSARLAATLGLTSRVHRSGPGSPNVTNCVVSSNRIVSASNSQRALTPPVPPICGEPFSTQFGGKTIGTQNFGGPFNTILPGHQSTSSTGVGTRANGQTHFDISTPFDSTKALVVVAPWDKVAEPPPGETRFLAVPQSDKNTAASHLFDMRHAKETF